MTYKIRTTKILISAAKRKTVWIYMPSKYTSWVAQLFKCTALWRRLAVSILTTESVLMVIRHHLQTLERVDLLIQSSPHTWQQKRILPRRNQVLLLVSQQRRLLISCAWTSSNSATVSWPFSRLFHLLLSQSIPAPLFFFFLFYHLLVLLSNKSFFSWFLWLLKWTTECWIN